jgi:hypothetical protein
MGYMSVQPYNEKVSGQVVVWAPGGAHISCLIHMATSSRGLATLNGLFLFIWLPCLLCEHNNDSGVR